MRNLKNFMTGSILLVLSFFFTANSFADPLPGPELISPSNGSFNVTVTPTLNWSSMSKAVSYALEISTDEQFVNVTYSDTNINDTSLTLGSGALMNNTLYFWRVSYKDNENITSDWSSPFTFRTVIGSPVLTLPINNAIGQGTATAFDWDNVDGADTYALQVSTDPQFLTKVIEELNLNSSEYTAGPGVLNINTQYFWRVKASNNDSEGEYSEAFTFTTYTLPLLNVVFPQNVIIGADWEVFTSTITNELSGGTFSNLTVPYEFSSTAALEQGDILVEYFDGIGWINLELTEMNGKLGGTFGEGQGFPLFPGQTFDITMRIKAGNEAPNGLYSVLAILNNITIQPNEQIAEFTGNFNVLIAVPNIPVLTAPKNGATSQPLDVILNWDDVINAETYDVQVSTDSQFLTTIVNETGILSSAYSFATGILTNGTEYYWRVKGHNTSGAGEYSEVFSFTTVDVIVELPSVPELLTPENGALDQNLAMTFDWSDADNAETYQLQISSDSSFGNTIVDVSNIVLSTYGIDSTILNNSTEYYWRVRATNVNGSSEYAEMFSFTTAAAPIVMPSTPELVSPSNGLTGLTLTPILEWNAADNADSYELQISQDTTFGTPLLEEINITSTDFAVQPGTLVNGNWYFWRVRSVNVNGSSEYSSVFGFRTISATPMIPVLLTPTHGSIGISVVTTFDWEDVSGAEIYKIQVSGDSLFNNIVIDVDSMTVSEFSNDLSPLNENTTYYWRVNAANKGGEGEYSSVFTFTTESSQPPAPVLLSPKNGASNIELTPVLDWNDADNIESVYEIEIALDNEFTEIVFAKSGLNVSEYTVETPLAQVTEHFWRIRYHSQSGSSEWSEGWSFTTTLLTGLTNIGGEIPKVYELNQNYPNPFNPTTKVRFGIPQTSGGIQNAKIVVYNMLGQVVANLFSGQLSAGMYEVQFDASALSSGTYFYELRTDNFRSVKRMTLVK